MTDQELKYFVEMLAQLTKCKKISWVRSKIDIGFVCCLAGEELIVFEVRGGQTDLIEPEGPVIGITSECRNVSYLWLQPTPGFEELLELLRSAPIDEKKFLDFRTQTHSAPVRLLKSLLRVSEP